MDPVRRKSINDAMVRLADGDRSAFSHLATELWPVMLSFARRALPQEADAEDVAQEVFYRICSRIGDFDCSRDALSWAFGIASYEVMTQRRRVLRRREIGASPLLLEVGHPAPSQEEALLGAEMDAALEAALLRIPESDRHLLREPVVGADPSRRKRKQRALARLRALVEEYLW